MEPGQVVFSKAGRDKGGAFVVLRCEGNYAYLADGRLRPLARPKKKKLMHIQPTNTVITEIKDDCEKRKYLLLDADIKKALLPFKSKQNSTADERQS